MLLRTARRDAQLSRRRAANLAGITGAHLIALERGWETVTEPTLATLLDAYGTTIDRLVPAQTPIAISGTVLVTGGAVQVAASSARDDVLRSYLELIRDARDQDRLATFSLRSSDLHTLSTILESDEAVLAARVATLLACDEHEARSFAKILLQRVAAPALGIAIGVSGAAATSSDARTTATPSSTTNTTTATVVTGPTSTVAPETVPALESEVTNVSAPPTVAKAADGADGSTGVAPTSATPTSEARQPNVPTTTDVANPATPGAADPSVTKATSTSGAPDTGILPGETPSTIFYGG